MKRSTQRTYSRRVASVFSSVLSGCSQFGQCRTIPFAQYRLLSRSCWRFTPDTELHKCGQSSRLEWGTNFFFLPLVFVELVSNRGVLGYTFSSESCWTHQCFCCVLDANL